MHLEVYTVFICKTRILSVWIILIVLRGRIFYIKKAEIFLRVICPKYDKVQNAKNGRVFTFNR